VAQLAARAENTFGVGLLFVFPLESIVYAPFVILITFFLRLATNWTAVNLARHIRDQLNGAQNHVQAFQLEFLLSRTPSDTFEDELQVRAEWENSQLTLRQFNWLGQLLFINHRVLPWTESSWGWGRSFQLA